LNEGNKVAIVTGGGQGLGRAIALKAAQRGYSVGLIGRTEKRLLRVREEVGGSSSKCAIQVCDVGDWGAVEQAVQSIATELGGVDVLVNNAGGWLGTSIEDVSAEDMRNLFVGSVVGAANCSKAVIPFMRSRGGGFILNIGSTSGLAGTTDSAVASTPKAAINIFSGTLAREVNQYQIRVSVLHPASVEKQRPFDEVPIASENGEYKRLGQGQVADIAMFMLEQPANVAIRELVVSPTNVFR